MKILQDWITDYTNSLSFRMPYYDRMKRATNWSPPCSRSTIIDYYFCYLEFLESFKNREWRRGNCDVATYRTLLYRSV